MRKRMMKGAASLLLAGALALFFPSNALAENLWGKYKALFINDDGRVVDFYQNQVTHTESQGYGMLLSVANNDKKTFQKIHKWLTDNMVKRHDSLTPWQWGKRMNGTWGIIDFNNATDGDILIALALLNAHKKFGNPDYLDEAKKIIKAIRLHLAIEWNGRTFLLTSYAGFAWEEGTVLNPSYLILPAYRKFAEIDDRVFWNKVYQDSLFILNKGRFGSYGLSPNWVILKDSIIQIYKKKKPRFSFAAVRTVLNLALSEPRGLKGGAEKIIGYYEKMGYIPQWVDLDKDSVSLYSGPAGYYAIFGLAAEKLGKKELSRKLFADGKKRLMNKQKNYYSFSLYLMATTPNVF